MHFHFDVLLAYLKHEFCRISHSCRNGVKIKNAKVRSGELIFKRWSSNKKRNRFFHVVGCLKVSSIRTVSFCYDKNICRDGNYMNTEISFRWLKLQFRSTHDVYNTHNMYRTAFTHYILYISKNLICIIGYVERHRVWNKYCFNYINFSVLFTSN